MLFGMSSGRCTFVKRKVGIGIDTNGMAYPFAEKVSLDNIPARNDYGVPPRWDARFLGS